MGSKPMSAHFFRMVNRFSTFTSILRYDRRSLAAEDLIIGAEFRQHFRRSSGFVAIVLQALVSGYIADRSQGSPANLPSTFRNIVGHGKNFFSVFVEKQVVVTEVLPRGSETHFVQLDAPLVRASIDPEVLIEPSVFLLTASRELLPCPLRELTWRAFG